MKDIIKVSIAGVAFTLDSEGYQIVKEYLDKLENDYAENPDGREIIADIEARMAELFMEESNADDIIGREQALAVTHCIGFPDSADATPPEPKIPKRFYRNPEGAVLGGVCSGLGSYFRTDPVWIRLVFMTALVATFISVFRLTVPWAWSCGVVAVVIYMILWLVVPAAKSPRQKLEMMGQKVTAYSIQQTIQTDNASKRQRQTSSVWANIFYIIGKVIMVCIKTILALILIGLAIAASIPLIMLFAFFIGANLIGPDLDSINAISEISTNLIIIIIAALIPIIIIGYLIAMVLLRRSVKRKFILIISTIWVILMVYLSVVSSYNFRRFSDRQQASRIELQNLRPKTSLQQYSYLSQDIL